MAFLASNWGVISASGNTQAQTLQNGLVIGAPGIYTYQSSIDTLNTISAPDYFVAVDVNLAVNDLIYIAGSDAAEWFMVLAVDVDTGNIIIGQNAGIGDVTGPASATNTAIARFNGTTGKLIENSTVLLDNSGNITSVTSISTQGASILPTSGVAGTATFWNPLGTFWSAFKAGANTGNTTFTWPINAPSANGQIMSFTTAGVGSWVSVPDTSWIDQTTTPATLVANSSYIADNAGLVTFNMPAAMAQGTVIKIAGKGAGGWLVRMNTGQVANLGNTATSSAGSLASTNQWDCIEILCVTANTTFVVTSVVGNITVA